MVRKPPIGEDDGNGAGRGDGGAAAGAGGALDAGAGAGRCIGCAAGAGRGDGGATAAFGAGVGVDTVGVAAGFALRATLRLATFFTDFAAEAFFAARFFGAVFAVFAPFFFFPAAALFSRPLVFLAFLDFFAFFAMIVLPIVRMRLSIAQ